MSKITLEIPMQLTDEAFAKLAELGNKGLAELRNLLYDYVPENLTQITRSYKRGDIIAKLFDEWLKANENHKPGTACHPHEI
jgi:hypothetical protein